MQQQASKQLTLQEAVPAVQCPPTCRLPWLSWQGAAVYWQLDYLVSVPGWQLVFHMVVCHLYLQQQQQQQQQQQDQQQDQQLEPLWTSAICNSMGLQHLHHSYTAMLCCAFHWLVVGTTRPAR